MRDYILTHLTDASSLDMVTIVLNNVVAIVLALFIMFTYWLTYTGTAYSKKFNVSLGMLVLITTMVMCVIGDNVALSLGMVGALSIIRFRTAVKDVRDATYLFWAIAAGICCGVSHYVLAGLSGVFVFVFLIIFRQFSSDGKVLLIVRSNVEAQNKAEATISSYFGSAANQTMRNASKDVCELVYIIRQAKLQRIAVKRGGESVVERLMKIEGVESVNLVEQTDDIGR